MPVGPSTAAVGAAVGGAGFGGTGDCAPGWVGLALRSGRGGRALTGAKPLGASRLRLRAAAGGFATLPGPPPSLPCRHAPALPLRPTALSLHSAGPPSPTLAPPAYAAHAFPCHLPCRVGTSLSDW